MTKNIISVPPSYKMAESLRNLGYSMNFAIADIIDNSIDANATEISVVIKSAKTQKDPVSHISIFDNGAGMNEEVLIDALTYGSGADDMAQKSNSSQLGCFGMGLKTASISVGRRLTVMTRSHSGELLCFVYDLDVCSAKKRYVITRHIPTDEEVSVFESHCHNDTGTGTWVKIENIDRCEFKNVSTAVASIRGKRQLPLTFRKFLPTSASNEGQCEILVNGKRLFAWGYDYVKGVKVLKDTFAFKLDDGTDLGTLKIINTLDTDHSAGHGRSQGIVPIRNNRDINSGNPEWHDVRVHDWELSGTYVLWEVNGKAFDDLMGTSLMKNTWQMPQSIRDCLRQAVNPTLKSYVESRKTSRKNTKNSDSNSLKGVTKSYSNNLNNNMNITSKPKVNNSKLIPEKTKNRNTDTRNKEESVDKKKITRVKKPFTYAAGDDEWIFELDPGCGEGRHFQVKTEEKRRGGRRFHMSVDTQHPWIRKYFVESNIPNSAMYAIYDQLIGDAYMELTHPNDHEADDMIRAKSNFLRTRSRVTTVHDSEPKAEAA